ncbi:FtsX-like permease family protein [Salsipaludibacter albus]|uniref:FtsX-like permease family protein n=1 Tax=Salsipaludibacter albus TaxID=2849650 RepID=UPI001EE48D36|nr:FtsX-like permease family protein [Salsipaludibacter albus]MBY5162971.1 hypothetical protein [Salsipaludibacter albus]
MTFRDLQHRARRVVVVTVLVGLVLTLLFLMTGLVHQLNTEPHRAVEGIGAARWVVADGVSGPFTSVSVLPADLRDDVGEGSSPVVVSRGTAFLPDGSDSEIIVFGHLAGELGSPEVVDGVAASGPGEVVVDESLGVAVGDVVEVGRADHQVVGLSRDTTVLAGLPFVFLDLADAQQLSFDTDQVVSAFLTTADPGPVDGATVLTAQEVGDDALGPLESAVASIDLIRALLWTVAAIVVGAVVYLSALERERDFAIMKAVGAGARPLMGGLALQSILVAVLAAALAAVVATLVEPVFPLAVRVPDYAYVQVPLVAAVVGLLAALVGIRRVNGIDPAAAFAGAGA